MSMSRRIQLVSVASFAVTACLNGPAFMNPKNVGELNDNASTTASIEKDEAGILTARINSSTDQTVQGSSDSAIANSSVMFPAGSLAIDTSITIEEGATIATDSVAAEIGLSGIGIEPAGSAVVLSADTPIDAVAPFTVALDLGGSSLHLAGKSLDLLIVLYKVYKAAEGKYVLGVIPNSAISVKDGKAYFEISHFGVYQAAYADAPVTEKKEADTTVPVLTKAQEKVLEPVVWTGISANFNTNGGILSVQGSATGFSQLAQCLVFADRDKVAPWDFVAPGGAKVGAEVQFGAVNDGTYFVRMDCTETSGRVSSSPWTSSGFVYKKPPAVQPDNVGPQVVKSSPANSATNFARHDSIVMTFDKPVNPPSLAGGCIVVKDPLGNPVPPAGPFLLLDGNRTVKFVPAIPLAMNARYTVVVQAGCAKDMNGNGTPGASWAFTTQDGKWRTTDVPPVYSNTSSSGITAGDVVGATNAAGASVMFFSTPSGTLMAAYKPAGGTWTSAQLVNTSPGELVGTAYVTPDGRPFALLKVGSALYLATYNLQLTLNLQAISWQFENLVETGGYSNVVGYDIAQAGDKIFLAYSYQASSPVNMKRMRVRMISDGVPSPSTLVYDQDGSWTPSARQIFRCNSQGACIFAVKNGTSTDDAIVAAVKPKDGSFGTAVAVGPTTAAAGVWTATITEAGRPIVFFADHTDKVIKAAIPGSTDPWVVDTEVLAPLYGDNHDTLAVDCVNEPNGTVLVAAYMFHESNESPTREIRVTHYKPGTPSTLSPETALLESKTKPEYVSQFQVKTNAKGDAVISGVGTVSYTSELFAAFRPKGGSWRKRNFGPSMNPTQSVHLDQAGNATVTFAIENDSYHELRASRLKAGVANWPEDEPVIPGEQVLFFGRSFLNPFSGEITVPYARSATSGTLDWNLYTTLFQ